MPRAGELRQFLRALRVRELKAIRKEFCSRVDSYNEVGEKSDFLDRLAGSLRRKRKDDEITFEELTEFLVDEIESESSRITTQIKESLRDIEFTGKGSETTKGIKENLLAAEVFQALRYGIESSGYEIHRELYKQGDRPDFVISSRDGNRKYLIEMKLARHGIEGLRSQLARYNSSFSRGKRTYALVLIEREKDLPKNNDKIDHELGQVDELSKTDYILKRPHDFRYEIKRQ